MKRLKFLLVIYFVFSFAIEGKCTNLPKVEKGSISILTKGGVNKSIEIACIESISRSGVNTIIHYESLSSDFKKVLANHSSVNINSVIRNSNWDVLEKINKNGAYLNFNYISEYPKYKNKNCTIKTPRFRYHVSRLTFNKAKEIMDRRTVQSNYLNYNRKYYSILKSYNDKILKDIDLKENMLFKGIPPPVPILFQR